MTWFDLFTFLEGLIPPLLIFLTAYFLIRSFLKADLKRRQAESDRLQMEKLIELKSVTRKELIPIRLQSYERLLLFLERNRLPALFLRIRKPGMSASALQGAMVRSFSEEFEHNLSQQLYVSQEAWRLLLDAKNKALDLITSCLPQEGEDSITYGSRLIDEYSIRLGSTFDKAVYKLVKEVEQIYF